MITLWQFLLLVVVAFALLARIIIVAARENDRRVVARDARTRRRPGIVPATTSMIDTDEYEYDLGDLHPESISQFVERITAEEAAKREAMRGTDTSGATQRAGHVTPRISVSGSSPDTGTIPRREAPRNPWSAV